MGTKPVHAVLGMALVSSALISGCRTDGGSGGAPGMIGQNTPRPGAFGRDPGNVSNTPSTMTAAANGQSPASVYGNQSASAASPAGRAYPNGTYVADNGTATGGPNNSWNTSRSSALPTGMTSATSSAAAPTNPYPANSGLGAGTSAGVTPVSYQQPMQGGQQPPPGAAPTGGFVTGGTSSATFPGGDPGAFRGKPSFSTPAATSSSPSTMTFSPGSSGDVGRTPAPVVEGAPPSGNGDTVYSVTGSATPPGRTN